MLNITSDLLTFLNRYDIIKTRYLIFNKEADAIVNSKNFGRNLARLRRKANITQRDIAQKCFVSVQAVSKWECGVSLPHILMLDDIAAVLGVEIKDLFEETED